MIVAIVPAAGQSRRMGRPKLLLPVEGTTLIRRVVAALRAGGASAVVVVTPPSDAVGSEFVGRESLAAGAEVVTPDVQPPDMRASVELGIRTLAGRDFHPTSVLLTPADSPGLSECLVALVIERARDSPDAIVIPTFEGKRGHPVAIPWRTALTIQDLPVGVGVNALMTIHAASLQTFEVDEPGALDDMDTPEDYARWSSTP